MLGGALRLVGRLGVCVVDVMDGVGGVVLGGCVALWCVDWCVGGMVLVVAVEGTLPVYIWRRAGCEGELGCWRFVMGGGWMLQVSGRSW